MLNIFIVALTLACVALTFGFLGTLRGIAEVRLRLVGAGTEGTQFRLDAGTGLPEVLLAALPDPRRLGMLLFLSEDCAACWKLLDDLSTVPIEGAPVTICINSIDTKMRAKLAPTVTLVDGDVAAQAFKQFKIDSTPVAVVHRDGYVVGSAYGSSAESIETLQRLWSGSSRPDSFRPSDQPVSLEPRKTAIRIRSDSVGGSKS